MAAKTKPALLLAAVGTLLSTPNAVFAESEATPSSPPATRKSVLVLDLKANNIAEETVAAITSFVTVEVAKHAQLKVLSGDDVKRMLQVEEQKQLLHCENDAGCMAELGGALGADLAVHGQVGRLEKRLLVTLTLVDLSRAQALSRVTVKADSLDALPEALEPAVVELMAPVFGDGPAATPTAKVHVDSAEQGGNSWPWLLAGGGAVLVVAGSAMTIVGLLQRQAFVDGKSALVERESDLGSDPSSEDIGATADLWSETETAREAWNSWGAALVGGGAPLAILGAGALTGAVVLGLLPDEADEEAP